MWLSTVLNTYRPQNIYNENEKNLDVHRCSVQVAKAYDDSHQPQNRNACSVGGSPFFPAVL